MVTNEPVKWSLEDALKEQIELQLESIVHEAGIEKGLLIDSSRIKILVAPFVGRVMVRALLRIATQQEEVFDYPNNLFTRLGLRWQSFKERQFPRWLLQRFPLRHSRVWAIHKFPEARIPVELLGREFVHFRVVDDDKLLKIGEEKKDA